MAISKDDSVFFSPFAFKLDKTFSTIQEAMESLKEELNAGGKSTITEVVENMPKHLLKRKLRDTSLGGNDTINCYPQFHEDDDLIHPIMQIEPGGDTGMGRVYSEIIDDRQQIMYMTFGVARYTNLLDFFTQSIDKGLASLMNNGEYSTVQRIAKMLGGVAGILIALPVIPLIWIKRVFDAVAYPVTRFYDLKVSMPLYYQLVNSIVAHLSVNMNITPMEGDPFDISKEQFDTDQGAVPLVTEQYTYNETQVNSKKSDATNASKLFEKHGVDVLKVLSRKDVWDGIVREEDVKTIDQHIESLMTLSKDNTEPKKGIFNQLINGFASGFYRTLEYVPFKIEKSADNSESASNSTGESELAGQMNSTVSSIRSKRFGLADGNIMDGPISDFVSSGVNAAKELLSSAMDNMGMSRLNNGLQIFSGNGFFDIPEMYQHSSFSKSYNFRVKLSAVYGDPLSILYSIYIPLAFFLAAAFPRAVGKNAYTSPFLLRAYCRGMFSIPLGIIDSISINRGSQEYGWNYNHLPLSIDVNFTVKDLAPVMFIAPSSSLLKSVFGSNSSFQEYMLTLGGVGIEERVLWINQLERRYKTSIRMLLNNTLNPMMTGYRFGNMNLVQSISKITGISRLPD